MTDHIALRGLRVSCVVGVHAWERKAPRELVLDVVLHVDTRAAAATDGLEDTVDYDAMATSLRGRLVELRPKLIEAAADAVAQVCLAHPSVASVDVTVRKDRAMRGTDSVSVEVHRRRPKPLPPETCCRSMAACLWEDDWPLLYRPHLRELALEKSGSSVLQTLLFCPWCGKRLPRSLWAGWLARAEKHGYQGIESPKNLLPDELHSDAWWRKNVKRPATPRRASPPKKRAR
jgi:7,8-dihydroneopterin aldolase/epimerase/oxygenase